MISMWASLLLMCAPFETLVRSSRLIQKYFAMKREPWSLLEIAAAALQWSPRLLHILTACLGSWLVEVNAAKSIKKYGVTAESAILARITN